MRSDPPPAQSPAAAPAAVAGSAGLQELYAAQLATRQFASDEAQLAVLARLEDLRQRLLATTLRRGGQLPHWLAALLGRAPEPPLTGLYLWGGVGRGKTWLMDLFCASLPDTFVRRRHFHRFMQEVHQHLGRLQHQLSPL